MSSLFQADLETDAPRFFMEIVDGHERVVAPVITDSEHRIVAGPEGFAVAPAKFRTLLSEADDAFDPIQHGIDVTALRFDVDSLVAVRAFANDRQGGFLSGRKT